MNVLIVDDQVNVIDGLISGVDFQKLGYEQVFGAASVEAALEILQQKTVDVLISDIEMPGKNGLELNAIVKKKYPKILRILLTSHARFSYAQEGLKLGCFDYLVQPVPYSEIEESLARAAIQIRMDERLRQMSMLGKLFDTHRTEFLNEVMLKLFGKDEDEKTKSMGLLCEAGYLIEKNSRIQLLLVDVVDSSQRKKAAMSAVDTIISIKMIIQTMGLPDAIQYIIGKNQYDQFAVLFFSQEEFELSSSEMETLYARLESSLKFKVTCYVSWSATMQEIRQIIVRLHGALKNNIAKEPGLVFVPFDAQEERLPTSLDEFISRWDALLKSQQKSLLRKDIFSYLDRNVASSSNAFADLCTLHQRITQMFFSYFYEKGIDIISLFNEEMTYEHYMESYSTIESVKQSVGFLLSSVTSPKSQEQEASYVERAKTYIMENTDKLLTVRDVSEYISLNPEYFTRLFKKETGYNIKDYIIQCKLTVAKDLLTNSNLPISMVALELGYGNFSHFTQMFKRIEGITPKEYRMQEKR